MLEENTYDFEIFPSPQQLIPKLMKGEISAGFLPPNMAVKIYNTSGTIKLLGITGMGNLYVISTDSNIHSLQDLKGKKILCAGAGATPQYVLAELLKKNGLESMIQIEYTTPGPSIALSVAENKYDAGIVPEPLASTAEKFTAGEENKLLPKFSISHEYIKLKGKDFPMTVLVVNTNALKNNPSEIKKFIADYNDSLNNTLKNPEQAGLFAEKYKLGLTRDLAVKVIPNSAYTWIPASDSRKIMEDLLSLFIEQSPETTENKFPDKGFYAD